MQISVEVKLEYYRGKNILITGAFGGFGVCFISQLLDRGGFFDPV